MTPTPSGGNDASSLGSRPMNFPRMSQNRAHTREHALLNGNPFSLYLLENIL